MYSQITNPKTNRLVSINSGLGTTILNNYINKLDLKKIGGAKKLI